MQAAVKGPAVCVLSGAGCQRSQRILTRTSRQPAFCVVAVRLKSEDRTPHGGSLSRALLASASCCDRMFCIVRIWRCCAAIEALCSSTLLDTSTCGFRERAQTGREGSVGDWAGGGARLSHLGRQVNVSHVHALHKHLLDASRAAVEPLDLRVCHSHVHVRVRLGQLPLWSVKAGPLHTRAAAQQRLKTSFPKRARLDDDVIFEFDKDRVADEGLQNARQALRRPSPRWHAV